MPHLWQAMKAAATTPATQVPLSTQAVANMTASKRPWREKTK